MKRLFFSVTMYLTAMFCIAQDYEPTSTWPYIYSDFSDGVLQQAAGKERPGKYNIHILEGRLHYIEKDMIHEANPAEIYAVHIKDDIYVNVGGTMMKVLAKSEHGIVAKETVVDMVRLNSTGGAYGSSSTTISTKALSSVEMDGNMSNMNHMELKRSKDSGSVLPLTEKIFLVFDGNVVYATRHDVLAADGVRKEEFTAFCKKNRIKWKEPQSLLRVIDFIVSKQKENL